MDRVTDQRTMEIVVEMVLAARSTIVALINAEGSGRLASAAGRQHGVCPQSRKRSGGSGSNIERVLDLELLIGEPVEVDRTLLDLSRARR